MDTLTTSYCVTYNQYADIQALITLSKWFIAGEGRNINFVRLLEGFFSSVVDLHFDPLFEDLQYAFALYGASTQDHDDKQLIIELNKVTPILDLKLSSSIVS